MRTRTSAFRLSPINSVLSAAFVGLVSTAAYGAPCPAPASNDLSLNNVTTDAGCSVAPTDVTSVEITNGSVVQGDLNNGGEISSVGPDLALIVDSSQIQGSVINNGNITERSGSSSSGGGARITNSQIGGNIINGGSIHTTFQAININDDPAGLLIDNSAVTGDFSNSGSMTQANNADTLHIANGSTIGAVRNESGGVIDNAYIAVHVDSNSTVQNGFYNNGSIHGQEAVYFDNATISGGGLINDLNGQINGDSHGFYLLGSTITGDVINHGSIDGSEGAIVLNNNTALHGGITNTGSLHSDWPGSAAVQVDSSTVDGNIANSGTITALDGAGIAVTGQSTTGVISNAANSAINGNSNGIYVNNSTTGNIDNSGSVVSGNGAGVYLQNNGNASQILNRTGGSITGSDYGIQLAQSQTGSIENSGTISGGNAAILLSDNSTVAGGILNNGTINGAGRGIMVDTSATGAIDNLSGGTIAVTDYGILVTGTGATVTGNISNEGHSRGSSGIWLADGATQTGDINNSGTIAITHTGNNNNGFSATAIEIGGVSNQAVTLNGNINNSGQITSDQAGIFAVGAATVTGSITNSGNINAAIAGMGATSSVVNSVANTALIQGDVVNTSTGTIQGTGYGIALVQAGVDGNVLNQGTISVGQGGMWLGGHVGGTASNSGSITSTNGPGLLISNNAVLDHSFSNTGSITGAEGAEVGPSTLNGDLVNSGSITGTAVGLDINGATINGHVINSGTITGTQALVIASSNTPLTVDNTGTLAGAVELGNATLNLNAGAVTGAITGVGSTVNINTGYAAQNTVSTGTLNVASGQSLTTGFALAATNGVNNNGTLSSSALIDAAVTNASGSALNLNGGSARVTGAINGGLVNVNGNFSTENTINADDITVASGATLTQANAIATPTLHNSGSVTSTALIDGAVANADGASLNLGTGSRVTGAVTGSGATVNVLGDFASENTLAANAVNVNSGATLTLANDLTATSVNNSGTIANAATINGALVGADGSTLTLEGANSRVTGAITGAGSSVLVNGTFANENTINVGNLNVAAGGVFNANQSVTTANGINNSGTLNNNSVLNSAVALNGGALNLASNGARVTGAVTGTAGSVINVNGDYTTENAFGADTLNIANGVLFKARHALGATTALNNNGTLDVRAATPITLTGNYVQSATGVYSMEAQSNSQYGKLNVTGTAALPANANIFVDVTSGASLTDGVLPGVITSSGLTASTFNVTDNSVLFDFTGVINGNNVDLDVKRGLSVTQVAQNTSNNPALGAAGALDAIITQGGATGDMAHVINQLGTLTSMDQISKAVTQMLPLVAGGTTSATAMTLNLTDRVVQARIESQRGLSAGDGYVTEREMWVKPFGSWADQKGDYDIAGYNADSAGLIIGVDGGVSDKDRAGVAFTYAHTHVSGDSTDAPQSASINNYQLMGYGSHSIKPGTDLSWQVDYGRNHTSGNRGIYFGDINRTADSSYDGWNAHVGAGIGQNMPLNANTNITPSVRLDYRTVHNEAYTETGADALNLHVDDQSTNELLLSTDAKLYQTINDELSWTANIGVGYDLLSKQAQITSTFVGGGPAFVTYGLNPSPWLFRGGAGLVLHRSNGLEITARYDGEGHKDFYNQTVSLKLRKDF